MTAATETSIFVERSPHWGGDVDRFTGRLVAEVDAQTDAASLAPIGLVLESRSSDKLARLADAARRILAEDEAALDPVLA